MMDDLSALVKVIIMQARTITKLESDLAQLTEVHRRSLIDTDTVDGVEP